MKPLRGLPGCTMVMSTGVVSIDLDRGGWGWPSTILLVATGIAWLAVLARGELARDVAGVPATCVLGSRLATLATAPAWALLAAGAALWCVSMPRVRGRGRATGSDFLPVVATQALAVTGATLGAGWLRPPSAALLAVGVALYLQVVARFDPRELLRGSGDQWVAGGALAICALASATLARAWPVPLRTVSVALWIAAIAWLAPLLAGELARPRRGGMPGRWSTVFPLGMYAAMSFAVAAATGTDWMRSFARGWTWVAFAAWAVVFVRWLRGD